MTATEDDITGWRTYVSPTTGHRGLDERYPTGVLDPDFFALLRAKHPDVTTHYQPATREEVEWARRFRATEEAHYAKYRRYCTERCRCGGWAREEAEWAERRATRRISARR